MKTKVQTVNKHAPQVEFILWHSNQNGYCPVGNREIIGVCNTRDIIKKTFKINAKQVEMVISKLADEEKVLVFGKNVKPFFETKIKKIPNVFFLGVNS